MRTDKKVAKYQNSPESEVYSKSRELYGLFFAKKSIQQEGEKLQQEEQQLAEESAVLQNRFTDLLQKAIGEINADGRYKMIVNSMMVIDAADGLNISSLVLSKIDELYEAGALTESVAE